MALLRGPFYRFVGGWNIPLRLYAYRWKFGEFGQPPQNWAVFPNSPDNIGCDPEEFLPNVLIGTNFSYTTGGYGLNLLSFQTLLGDTKRAILSHRREILWPYSYRGKFGKFGKTFRNWAFFRISRIILVAPQRNFWQMVFLVEIPPIQLGIGPKFVSPPDPLRRY